MKTTERELDFELTTDTPYLALTGELWGICGEDFGENRPRYNGTALYIQNIMHLAHILFCRCLILVGFYQWNNPEEHG